MKNLVFSASKVAVLGLIGTALSAGCASAPKKPATIPAGDYSYMIDHLSWMIPQQMAKHNVTGVSIAVVDDQEMVWAEGFGYADKAGNVPAMPETLYEVGSISKLFTVTAAMQLAEQGKIDIDHPLQEYLPQFSIKSRFENNVITPRTIMTHHSGIPGDWLAGMFAKHPGSFTELVANLKDEYTAYPTNFVFAYSNVAMTLLGHMVQEVAGRPFTRHMEESVLGPIGMKNSSFVLRPDMEMLMSKSYSAGKEVDAIGLRDLPAGSLRSNVLDLSEFMKMVFAHGKAGDNQILRPETLAEMLRPQNADVPLDLDTVMGLGWFLSTLPGISLPMKGAGHGGDTIYFHALLITIPEHKIGVILLTNSTGGQALGPVVAEVLLLAVEAKTGVEPPRPEPPARSPVVGLSSEQMAAYVGHYATEAGLISVQQAGAHLETHLMGNKLRLVAHEDGKLSPRPMLLGLFPVRMDLGLKLSLTDIENRKILIAHQNGQRILFGEKIEPTPIPDAWRARLGRYEIANVSKEESFLFVDRTELADKNGFLVIRIEMDSFGLKAEFPLRAINDHEAIFRGLGRRFGETIRITTTDGEERFFYSGYSFRKVGK